MTIIPKAFTIPEQSILIDVRPSNQKPKAEITVNKTKIVKPFEAKDWVLTYKFPKANTDLTVFTNNIELITKKLIFSQHNPTEKLSSTEQKDILFQINQSKSKLTKGLKLNPNSGWYVVNNKSNYSTYYNDPMFKWHLTYVTPEKVITDSFILTDNFNFLLGLLNGFSNGKAHKGSTYRDEVSKRNPYLKQDWILTKIRG